MGEMLKAYEKQIKELEKRLAKLSSAAEQKETTAKSRKKDPWLEEYVDIKLFKGSEAKLKDDVFVSVNGENCVIPRGRWFKIKRKFALVIDQSEIQDQKTLDMMDAKAAEWEAASNRI